MFRHHNPDFPLASPEEQEPEGESKKRDRIEVGGGKEDERENDIKELRGF